MRKIARFHLILVKSYFLGAFLKFHIIRLESVGGWLIWRVYRSKINSGLHLWEEVAF